MSAYASVARVKAILDSEVEPDLARFDALNAVASTELDSACRVTGFGLTPGPRTITYPQCAPGPLVVLDPPVLAATTVSSGDAVLDPADFQLVWPQFDRWRGLARIGGFWSGTVAITGDFADQPPGPVPAEITEAASVLVAGYLRRDRLPAGEVSGPEGFAFRPSNPWTDERVQRAVARYRLRPLPL